MAPGHLETQFARDDVPQVVRESIRRFEAPPGFALAPKTKHNTSVAFSWGVRLVETANPNQFWWVCRASDACRQGNTRVNMMRGKTSKVTEHLKNVHGIVSSKTETTKSNKRRQDDEVAAYEASDLYRQHPGRCMVLLETLKIVANNLAFSSVETKESALIRRLCYKEAAQTPINRKIVQHSIVELYASGKGEIIGLINATRGDRGAFFTLVTDFWTSEIQKKKYIGVRLYMIDATFCFRSVLLATRQFDPPFGDRDRSCKSCRRDGIDPCPHSKHKIRYPFRRWILNILRDFGIQRADLFGSTTDAGSDVKWMMSHGFSLRWEWCLAHLANAATKVACGLVDDTSKSKNRPMTGLLKKITTTVYQAQHVEVMGTLFKELCGSLSEDGTTQLLSYRSHRFIGLTRVIDRILLKWDVLKEWYAAREAKAVRERATPPVFPLMGHKRDLIQLLSLLQPIATFTTKAQAESPIQVDVLLDLFKLRLRTLNPAVPLRHYRSLAPTAEPEYFQTAELTQVVRQTRQLLCDAFHVRYFRRYTERREMARCSFVFEMQLALHPDFKDLEGLLRPVVQLSNQQYGENEANNDGYFDAVVNTIKTKLVNEMTAFINPTPATPAEHTATPSHGHPVDDNFVLFRRAAPRTAVEPRRATCQAHAELVQWQRDDTGLLRDENGQSLELVTEYWARQAPIGWYSLLPLVVRALFAVPSTSAQMERDFGNSGRQVTPQRSLTGGVNVDMSAFVNCNREFIDPKQCTPIPRKDRDDHMPSNVHVTMITDDDDDGAADEDNSDDDIDFNRLPPQVYSNTSIYDGNDDDGDDDPDTANDDFDDYE